MPQFPPGVPNNVSVTPVAIQVFTPNPATNSSCRFYNPGLATVYVGGPKVSPINGLPIAPGNRPVELQNVNTNLYACSGFSSVIATTTTGAAYSASTTTVVVAGSLASMVVGVYLQIGDTGTGVEYVQVQTVSTSALTVGTTALLYDHASGVTVSTLNVTPGPLSVQAGVS